MNLTKATLMICGLLALNACSFNRKNVDTKIRNSEILLEQSKKTLDEQTAATITKDDVKVEFVGTKNPNIYNLKVQWPKTVPKVEIELNQEKYSVTGAKGVFEIEIPGGSKIDFNLKSKTTSEMIISNLNYTETAPKDYVFDGIVLFDKDFEIGPEYNRAYFANESTVFLNGKNLTIATNQIVFGANSKIITLSNALLNHGSSNPTLINEGVKIHLEAKSAIGMVHIYMMGVDGADGKNSWQLAYELYKKDIKVPAADGAMGAPGLLQPDRCTVNKAGIEICKPSICRGATPGGNGQDGLQAPDAEDGFNGGSPGQLKILIDDYSQAEFRIYEKAGRPGKGGKGHPSQQGGRGGEKHPKSCLQESGRGSDGITPPEGRDGEDGREANALIAEIPRDPAFFLIQPLNNKNNPFVIFSQE